MKQFDGKFNHGETIVQVIKYHSEMAIEHYHETVNHFDMTVDHCDSR